MIEFSALGIFLLILSKAYNDSIKSTAQPSRWDIAYAVLSFACGAGSLLCLVIVLFTAPWGRIL